MTALTPAQKQKRYRERQLREQKLTDWVDRIGAEALKPIDVRPIETNRGIVYLRWRESEQKWVEFKTS